MTTRRILIALIAALSVFICLAGAGVAGLAYVRLGAGGDQGAGLFVLDGERLRLLAADGRERVLAEDLSGDMFRYPAPAPDGERIAFISRDENGMALNSLHLRTGERVELYRSADSPPLYATWAPDGRTLSFLSNQSRGGLGVHTVAADGSAEAELLNNRAGSSYFAWRPDGESLLLHAGGSSFEGGSVAVYGRAGGDPAHELRDTGFFQAPAWSADGSGYFYVAQPAVDGPMRLDAVESLLTRVAADGTGPQVLAREPRAGIIFSRSPAGDDIAYITTSPGGYGALKVVDAAGGEPRVVSSPGQAIPAFFWSPDGSQLAYLTFEPQIGGLPRFTWHVVAKAGGAVRELASFTPSQAFVGVVNYFDAYAFVVDLWSPDGRELVYASDEGVIVVEVAGGTETRRAAGELAMWARKAP